MEAEADETVTEFGYACTPGGRHSATEYLSGGALVPCGFEASFGYLPEFRVTDAGSVMVKATGECTMFPDTGPMYDFQNACKTHDYGFDLLRVDVLDSPKEVNAVLHRHTLANCAGRSFLGTALCKDAAMLVQAGVAAGGVAVNFESELLEGFNYYEMIYGD